MHRLFTIPTAYFVAAALSGCVADNGGEGIFIISNTAAPEMGCSFTGNESQPFLPHGTFSIHSPTGYSLYPLMKSRITATPELVDTRTVLVEGARVNLTFPDESVFSAAQQTELRNRGIMRFTSLFAAPLSPNGGTANGSFNIITTALLDELVGAKGNGILAADAPSFRAEVVATVVVFGDMAGGEVTSQEFQYPVTICNDCVAIELGACPLPAETEPRPGNSCNPYQDGVADCCRMGADVVCPGIVALP